MEDQVCLYDGTTIFVQDPRFIDHLLKNPGRYNLKGNFDLESHSKIAGFTGSFRNFRIHTAHNSRGPGIVLGGSLHKWKNRSHNYDVFYWHDFLKVYEEILTEFPFDPQLNDLWVL